MATPIKMRRLKWIGDAPWRLDDGWRVANWTHEAKRILPVVGHSTRRIRPQDIPGLTREYIWGKRGGTHWDLIQDVDPVDAALILKDNHREFVDVTDHSDPLSVKHEPIIIYQDPKSKKWYRTA